ncbi:hscarg dehydrogenase [Aspergillus affinis]|uniref:hscarg dehydrogenase n=1 Tax=Aspergillus affinis TaxID=1070780 RepID=UPI0022FDED95|nr:hscarg dehydrogenase [Aspergillus affinis]KAI9036622.1 hscarg dehydrogenase [Aspergillus affinis]
MPLLVLTNATSHQSRSIISAIQSDPSLSKEYTIRGLTRDPSSARSQSLATSTGIELVYADVSDSISLRTAFQDADIVFATTITLYDGHTYDHEVEHGKAIADAAVAMAVPYLIYSTLPSIKRLSGGVLSGAGQWDGKSVVEEYIRGLPIKAAFICPGSFMENFHAALAPRRVPHHRTLDYDHADCGGDEGEYALTCFVSPTTKLPLIAVESDFGKWVAAMVADFERFEYRVVCAATRMYSLQEIVDIMSTVSGKRVVYNQVGKEAWGDALPPARRPYMLDMMQWFQDYGYFGEGTEGKVRAGREEAKVEVIELEEYLRRKPLVLR